MKIKVKEINHPGFIVALTKLENHDRYPKSVDAWHILQMSKKLRELMKEQRDLYQKLVRQYAETDETGALILDEQNNLKFKTTEAEKEHEAKFIEFMEVELEIPGKKMSLDTLDKVGFSPIEIDALSFMVEV